MAPETMDKYPLGLRILHWLIALLIIGLLTVGLIMTDMPKVDALGHENELRSQLYSLHKSFGLSVLALVALRLFIRLKQGTPPLPAAIPAVERKLAHLGHLTLYAFMFLMPMSGYIMTASRGIPVKWFGIPLPRVLGVHRELGGTASDIHTYAAYTLIGLLLVHVGAVIEHYVRQKINLLKRMV